MGKILSRFSKDWGKTFEEESAKKTFKKDADPRFFMPAVEKDKSYRVTARILPSPDTDLPYIERGSHFVKGLKGVMSCECPQTSNVSKCPICAYAWSKDNYVKDDKDHNKKYSEPFRAKRTRVWNILIIKDTQNSDNNGKVFLWEPKGKFQTEVLDPFISESKALFGTDSAVYPWDVFAGVNINIRATNETYLGKSYVSFDKSDFKVDDDDPSSSITSLVDYFGDEEKTESFLESKLYSLADFIDEKNFKSEDELKSEFSKVMGFDEDDEDSKPKRVKHFDDDDEGDVPPPQKRPAKKEAPKDDDDVPFPIDDDGDDDAEFFKRHA